MLYNKIHSKREMAKNGGGINLQWGYAVLYKEIFSKRERAQKWRRAAISTVFAVLYRQVLSHRERGLKMAEGLSLSMQSYTKNIFKEGEGPRNGGGSAISTVFAVLYRQVLSTAFAVLY